MYKKIILGTLLIVGLLLVSSIAEAQCAMCRATVGSNLSEGRGVIGTGINFGILYLLATPYILVGGLFLVYRWHAKKEFLQQYSLKERLRAIYKTS